MKYFRGFLFFVVELTRLEILRDVRVTTGPSSCVIAPSIKVASEASASRSFRNS